MQAEDIETYLADLGQELQRMGQQQPVRLLLVGGAFMLTQFHNRVATKDVDVLLKDVDDSTTSSLYQTFDDYILALKLLAGRTKDRKDIQVLCQQLRIHSRQQAQQIVDRYIPDKQVQQLNKLDKKLAAAFP